MAKPDLTNKQNTEFPIRGVNHLALVCKDMAKTVDFYTNALGLNLVKMSLNQDDPDTKHYFWANYDGSEVKYEHPERGFNSRLDTLQAVVLLAKLARLASWNAARTAAAERYDALLGPVSGVTPPAALPGNVHVWHLYVVRVPDRDRVRAELARAGIDAGLHYPIPIHLQGAFRDLGHRRGDFPAAEKAAAEVLSLPIYPGITAAQQERVAAALRAALG